MVVESWKLHGHMKRGQGRGEHREVGMFPSSQLGRAPLKKSLKNKNKTTPTQRLTAACDTLPEPDSAL